MAKKRNCRKDPIEKAMHERAVKIRKMTDEQLINKVDGLYQEGFDNGMEHMREMVLNAISFKSIKGIGPSLRERILQEIRYLGEGLED